MFERGRPLNAQERALYKPYFANMVIDRARIVDGKVPFWLRHEMCAVVLGECVYFRKDAYVPNTQRGVELLGHELTHISQFLHGMTTLKYLWSCRRGYMNSIYEIEAYAKGRMIAKDYQSR
jgi:Domain of unknown function (DUF4157)